MALRPEISLGVRTADVGQAFNNALLNVQRFQNIQQTGREAPLRNRLLEAQAGGAEAKRTQQEQLNRFQSVAFGATEILPDLQSGNAAGAMAKLQARRQQLISQGKPTETTDAGIALLGQEGGLQQLLGDTTKIISAAQQQGILKAPADSQRGKFIGTPSRVERDGQSFLSGIVQQPDGSFGLQEVPIGGEFVSPLGETAAEQERRVIREAGGKTTATLEAEKQLKPEVEGAVTAAKEAAKTKEKVGSAEKVGAAQQRINFLATTGNLEAADINLLKKTSRSRKKGLERAIGFRDALQSGLRTSGVGRRALDFLPIGVWTDQGSFDEIFNAFAEVAAREKLKASGELRPTDADVQGMKAAMFGVGRSEEANIVLLNDFIEEQEGLEKRLSAGPSSKPAAQPQVIRFDAQGNIIQ